MRVAIVASVLLAVVLPVEAELAFAYTAESLVVMSHAVVTGEVISFSPPAKPDSNTPVPFRIKVHRRLYGPHDAGDIITVYGSGDVDVAQWTKHAAAHTPALFFIGYSVARRGPLQGRYGFIFNGPNGPGFVQTDQLAPLYRKDGSHIADYAELLRLTEAEATLRLIHEGRRKVARRTSVDAPHSSAAFTENYNRSMVRLFVSEYVNLP